MGKGGFEPPRPRAHDPKSCSSASSDTSPDTKLAVMSRNIVNISPESAQRLEWIERFIAPLPSGTPPDTIAFYHTALKKLVR